MAIWRITFVSVLILSMLLISVPAAGAQGEPISILFMHHSTGGGLIWEGGVRESLAGSGYEFWDHGYNDEGLVDPSGNYTGTNWNVPGDNTDPDGWYAIFNQPVTSPPSNTFSHMLEYDVIIFKSCFPSSNIYDEGMYQQYQQYFLSIRDVMDQHSDKLFIPFTTPPLVPNETTPENAARARRWAEYLTSDEYLAGHPNIAVFDFFSELADETGYLRAEYRMDEWDSHPNTLANQTVGPVFVEFVDSAARDFYGDGAVAAPGEPSDAAEVEDELDAAEGDEAPADVGYDGEMALVWDGELLEDFEDPSVLDQWWDYTNADVPAFDCGLSEVGYESSGAIQLTYQTGPDGSAGCGVNFETGDSWADAVGFRFAWRSSEPGMILRVALAVEDPSQANPDVEGATPFEIELQAPGETWTQVVIRWEDLEKAQWVDGGVEVFDPARVVWMALDVGHWEMPQQGIIWLDDFQLVLAE
ncbi:MAG: hypothetical protein GYB65_11765 [Chloroflexi bacterium]|nr:hypothetical protein [Chloroflexota bacterium]